LRFTAALTLFCLISSAHVEAQPNCKKGKPCGNSCISRDKVCRIGTTPAPAPAPLVDAKAAPLASVASVAVKDLNSPWVAFKDGSIYYRNVMGCEVARVPEKAERVYFKSEEDAKRAGLAASKEAGCQ
jgi:deoxyribonuclease-1